MKKPLPIEKLVRWALVDELPKGHAVSTSAWDTIMSYSRLGTRIDASRYGSDGFGFVSGTPHPDAEVVADALRALPQDFQLGEAACATLAGHYAVLDTLAARAVGGAQFNMPALVIRCAILDRPMEWETGLPCARVVRHSNKHAIVFGFDDDGRIVPLRPNRAGNYPFAAQPRSHVEYVEPTVGELIEARAEYVVWHRALVMLCDALRDKPAEHEATPPEIAPAPWTALPAAKPAVHRSEARKMAKLPLSPKRNAPLPPLESEIQIRARLARSRRPRAKKPETAQAIGVGGFYGRVGGAGGTAACLGRPIDIRGMVLRKQK